MKVIYEKLDDIKEEEAYSMKRVDGIKFVKLKKPYSVRNSNSALQSQKPTALGTTLH